MSNEPAVNTLNGEVGQNGEMAREYSSIEIKQKIINAYEMLLENDLYLLQNNVNERSLTHRLAIYLEAEFPSWHVDCEYNRMEGMIEIEANSKLESEDFKKRLDLINLFTQIEDYDDNAQTVFPDIIVHIRGTERNLLVIEAKKKGLGHGKDCKKLKAFVKQFSYKHAFQVIFPVEDVTKEDLNLENLVLEYSNE